MPENVGPYDVKTTINHLGPIDWVATSTDSDGIRRANMADSKPAALPPELNSSQQSVLAAGVLASTVHDFILPELEKRFGAQVSEYEFLTPPEWESRAHKILVVVSPDGESSVSLNDEVTQAKIPPTSGSALLIRSGYTWQIKMDWLPLYPEQNQTEVREAVEELAAAILKGDEQAAAEMAQRWFPGTWRSNPESIQGHLHKEIYVLLLRIWDDESQQFGSGSGPLDVVPQRFPSVAKDLRSEYDWESLGGGDNQRLDTKPAWAQDFIREVDQRFSQADLSPQELLSVRLEAALALQNEKWSERSKAQYLGVGLGTHKSALHRARGKLANGSNARFKQYQALIRAVLGD